MKRLVVPLAEPVLATTPLSQTTPLVPSVEAKNPRGDVSAEPDPQAPVPQVAQPAIVEQKTVDGPPNASVPVLDIGMIDVDTVVSPPPSAVILPRTSLNMCHQLRLTNGSGHPWLTFNANRLFLTGPDNRVALSESAVPARSFRQVAEDAITAMIQRGTLPLWVRPAREEEVKELEHKTPRLSDVEWEDTIARLRMVQVHVHGKSYFCSPNGYILDCATRAVASPRVRAAIREAAQVSFAASLTSESVTSEDGKSISSDDYDSDERPDAVEVDDPLPPPEPVLEAIVQAAPEQERCAICLEPLIGFHPVIRALPCAHRFHGACIDIADPPLDRCPVCRAAIPNVPMPAEHLAQRALDLFRQRINFDPGEPVAIDVHIQNGVGGWEPVIPPPMRNGVDNLVRTNFWVSANTIAAARHVGIILAPGDRSHPHPMHSASRACLLKRLYRDNGPLYTLGLNPEHIGGLPDVLPCTTGRINQNFHGFYGGPTCTHSALDFCDCARGRTIVHFAKPEMTLETAARLALVGGHYSFFVVDNRVLSARQELGSPDKTEFELENDDHPQHTEALLYVTGRGTVVLRDLSSNTQYTYPFPKWQQTNSYTDAMGNRFRVELRYHMKDLGVWHFEYDERPAVDVPPILSDMTAVAMDRSYVGPLRMTYSPDSPDSSVHIRGNPTEVLVYCAHDYIVADNEDPLGVFIPKAVLNSAMASVAFMPRGPQVTAAVRSLITRELRPYGLSTVEALKSVTMMVPMALSGNVLNEVGAWQVSVEPLLPAMERARQMLNYVPRSLTSFLTTPTFERSYARLQLYAQSVGNYISHYPYQIVVLGSLLTLLLVSSTLSLLGPGEQLPPTRTISGAAWHWWNGAQETIVSLGSQAYAMTFPECSAYWLRRLGYEPPCRYHLNGQMVVLETFRNAWYYRAALHTGAIWFFFFFIFFEETLKRLTIPGHQHTGLWILIVVETLKKFGDYGSLAIIAAPTVAVLHCYLRNMPFWKAVCMHMMWNMTIAVFELPAFTATIGPSAMSLIAVYAAGYVSYYWPMPSDGPVVLGPRYEVPQANGSIDAHASIEFATRFKPYDPSRPAMAQMGPIVPGAIPTVPATTSTNLYSALRDRHLLPKRHVAFTRGQLLQSVKFAMFMLPLPTSYKQFNDETTFWPQKFSAWYDKHDANQKRFLDRAIEHLKLVPYRTGFSKHHRCFTKREKLLKHCPVPRLVLTVSPEFAVTAGPFLWSVAKWFKTHWRLKPIFYCPGATVEDISAWFQWHVDHGYEFIEEDMSRCDSSYHAKLLKATAHIYQAFYIRPRVDRAIRAQYPKCVLHGNDGTWACVDGTLCTGSHETTIGNTKNIILNKLAAWIPEELQGVQAHYGKLELAEGHRHPLGIMQAGDDGLNAVHPDFDIDPVILTEFGYRAKTKRCTPDTATFLSGRFYRVGTFYVWGPKAGRQIAKIGIDIEFDPNPLAKMRGVAMGMRNLTSHIPLLGVLIKRILDLTQGVRAKPIFEEWKPMAARAYDPTPETYEHFARIYDTTYAEIIDCEQYLAEVGLYEFMYHPLLEKVISIDAE